MSVTEQEIPVVASAAPPDVPHAAAFEPYIPPERILPELTILPLIIGTLLGIIFGASSLYLVLKVGLTVSASIPVADISITVFPLIVQVGVRATTILRNIVVHTAGTVSRYNCL